jgi:membrane AbrB-like protein
MLIGSMLGTAVLGIGFDHAYMHPAAQLAAQVTAGAFIACGVSREDLRQMKKLAKPALILTGGYLIFNFIAGYILYFCSNVDWLTSMFCAVPGGMADSPIIAIDMGAKGSTVTILHFSRLVFCLSLFPGMIAKLTPEMPADAPQSAATKKAAQNKSYTNLMLTMLVATVFGVLGRKLGVPAGGLSFSLIAVIIFKLLCDRAYLPKEIRIMAQLLAGTYIGSSMNYNDVVGIKDLIVPVIILAALYTVACIVIGKALTKFCGIHPRIAFLTTTPAGANDMALISADLGVHSADLVVLQLVRMLVAIIVNPQVINIVRILFYA